MSLSHPSIPKRRFRKVTALLLALMIGLTVQAFTALPAQADTEDRQLPVATSLERQPTAAGAAARRARFAKIMQSSPYPTWGDISCHNSWPFDYVKTRAWGVDYPRNTEIEIHRDITINNDWWRSDQRVQRTSSSGSWSTPTNQYDTALSGEYELFVYVYRNSDGKYLGFDGDRCYL